MRDSKNEIASDLQHPIPLAEHCPVIVDVLQAVAGKHCIVALIHKWQVQPIIARIIQSHSDCLRHYRL